STPSRKTAAKAMAASPTSRPVASARSARRRRSPPIWRALQCIHTTIQLSTPTASSRTPACSTSCASGPRRAAAPSDATPTALAVQLEALELDRDRGLVRDLEAQALARRRLDLGGREAVLGDRQRDGPLLGPHRRGEHEEEAERESAHAARGASRAGAHPGAS